MTSSGDQSRIFTLVLVAKPGASDPYLAIRALLKLALRRYGLRCTQAREISPPLQPERTQAHEIDDRTITSGRRQ